MDKAKDDISLLQERKPDYYLVMGFPSEQYHKLPRRLKLTKSAVDGLLFEAQGQRLHHDSELPGFGLVVGCDTKTYIAQADINGRSRRVAIGRHGLFTADQARKRARKLLQMMRAGIDPLEEQRKAKALTQTSAITLREAFAEYKSTRNLKPNTMLDYERLVNRCFEDWLSKPVTSITKQMVLNKHQKIKTQSGHPYADYSFRVLSSLLNYVGARYDDPGGRSILPDNPVRVLSRIRAWGKPKRRTTIIAEQDLPAWFKALDCLRNNQEQSSAGIVCDYLELVLLTGLRRNEAVTLKWDQIDFDEKVLIITDTKNDEPHILPLTNHLVIILRRRETDARALGSEYVFPSSVKQHSHLVEPRYIADLVTKASGVTFTIHDLRRTFCTVAEGLDIGYYALKKLMNHKMSGDITRGYQRSTVKRLREPMERITNYFLEKKAKRPRLKIVAS